MSDQSRLSRAHRAAQGPPRVTSCDDGHHARAPHDRADRRPRRPAPLHRLRHRDQAAVQRGGPAGRTSPSASASPASTPTRAACTATCTASSCGRCASTRATPARRSPTSATATCSRTARTGLSMAFDLPTQLGLDSDDPRCLGEVGRTGVAIDTIDDMRTAFDGIPLDEVSTVDDDQRARRRAAAALRARRRGAGRRPGAAARHHPERHPQGVHRPRELHLPARARDAADHGPVRLLRRARSRSGTRSRSPATTSARRAARAVQEVAFTLANGIAYVQAALDAGLEVDDFAPRLAFFFNGHNNVFQEVAKFRAARQHVGARSCASASARRTRALMAAALPHPDRRRHADRPAAGEQHRARRAAGLRRGLRRHAVAAHQRLRRGARAAHRARRQDRAAHAADHRPRVRRRRHRRPVRRLLLRRGAHRRDRATRPRS